MKGITDKAGSQLKTTLEESTAQEGQYVRLAVNGGQGTLKLDSEDPADEVFEHEGEKVLLVDPVANARWAEATLDYDGQKFHFV